MMTTRGLNDDSPLVDYVTSKLWGNPEENKQYQVKINQISGTAGVAKTFPLMNKWRNTPGVKKHYDIFTAGGLDAGYWNLFDKLIKKDPFDRWIRLSELAEVRGVHVDIYNAKGIQYPRTCTWIMRTNDGLTLLAIERLKKLPIEFGIGMFFRCYTPSTPVLNTNPFKYITLIYENNQELSQFNTIYSQYKAKAGFTGVYVNGVYFNDQPINIPNIDIGDVVEIWHDPSVIKTELYAYRDLKDFYSELDRKRKVILHPPRNRGNFKLRYFDDNDYFLVGTKQRGLYFNRNDETTIRQLTHVDVSISDDTIRTTCGNLFNLATVTDVHILVLVRDSDWALTWPNEHQRIRYLYRLDDSGIMKAFTGARANMEEWTANELERGPVLSLLRGGFGDITKAKSLKAVGYNAATRVMSENVIRATYLLGGRGVEIPFSYRHRSSAWEHNANGELLGYYNVADARYYSPVNQDCAMVEFIIGEFGRVIDALVTKENTVLDAGYDYRVYRSNYSVLTDELIGEWTDVTDNPNIYVMEGDTLVWTGLNKVNQRGIIISNKKSLGYSFELDHLDKNLSFLITEIYEEGGLVTPIGMAQIDLWLNNRPLIDKVDWVFEDGRCYIFNKEFIVDGPQLITVRANGFTEDPKNPLSETELGFVDGGVIGRGARYNLRANRTTRTVINGRLFITDEVPRAEREVPDNQWDVLNGRPYMVKHVLTPIKAVVDFKSYPDRDVSRKLDKKIVDYLTKYLPKPTNNDEEIHWEPGSLPRPSGSGIPVIPNLQDKYRLFSPFMNAVVNGILNNLITLPNLVEGETAFSNQDITELLQPLTWWLRVDPITLQFDKRYFAIIPYANFNKLTVSSKEFLFIKQVNDLYLNSVCVIEGHFEVNNNV